MRRTALKGFETRWCLGDIDAGATHSRPDNDFSTGCTTTRRSFDSQGVFGQEAERAMTVKWYTYGEMLTKAQRFGYALQSLVHAAFVGICSNNR
jgi:hypothetical protein